MKCRRRPNSNWSVGQFTLHCWWGPYCPWSRIVLLRKRIPVATYLQVLLLARGLQWTVSDAVGFVHLAAPHSDYRLGSCRQAAAGRCETWTTQALFDDMPIRWKRNRAERGENFGRSCVHRCGRQHNRVIYVISLGRASGDGMRRADAWPNLPREN